MTQRRPWLGLAGGSSRGWIDGDCRRRVTTQEVTDEFRSAAERGYLAMLAGRLGLPDELVAAIHEEAQAGDPQGQAQDIAS